ncbi:MAG: membrane protein insertase YidC [Oligoflexia bacterium]|nr:membrane protein insertase YidC [Oligoflexia bacterium]
MDKNAILAVMISLAIWVGWQKFYLEPIQKKAAEQTQKIKSEAKPINETNTTEKNKTLLESSSKNVSKKVVAVSLSEMDLVESKIKFSNSKSFIDEWSLNHYSTDINDKEKKVNLSGISGFGKQLEIRFSDQAFNSELNDNWQVVQDSNNKIVQKLETDQFLVEREFSPLTSDFSGELKLRFRFLKETPKFIFLDFYGSPQRPIDHDGSIFGQAPDKVHVTYLSLVDRKHTMASSLDERVENMAGIKWIGIDTRYFVFGLVPDASLRDKLGVQVEKEFFQEQNAARGSLVIPTESKQEVNFSTKVYFGPKKFEYLEAVDPILIDTIDFGWTSFLAMPLLKSLKWLYKYVHNYGIAIIILTFVIKMLLLPLTYKSMKSMAKISKLQPQLNALREKYKDDKEKLNAEMMSFMKNNGYNPVGGCLPILLQMPIFFALYRVLFNSMELYQAPFYFWIQDLAAPDRFFVTPVLLTALMYFQQKISPNTATDPTQQKMLQFMPVMFGVFMLMLPAGLNIYMLVNSATSIAQQWFLNRKLGIVPASRAVKA